MGWVWPFDQVARNNLPNHSLQGGMKHIRWLASNQCPKGLSTSMLKSGKHNMSLLQIYPPEKAFQKHFILDRDTGGSLQTLLCSYPSTREKSLRGTISCIKEDQFWENCSHNQNTHATVLQ